MSSAVLSLYSYPKEPFRMGWAGFGSVMFHVFLALMIGTVAYLQHDKTLKELMLEGGAIAESGPAAEQEMSVVLQTDEPDEVPPVENPEFAREIEKPKPVEKVVEEPKPVAETPAPPAPRPKYTAQGATGSGESMSASKLVVGSSGFPRPGYPFAARKARQSGTVLLSVQFDGSGRAAAVSVIQSSGVSVLDSNSRTFVRANWQNPSFAGKVVTVPIEYNLTINQ
jgi:TonB family protein